MSDTPPAPKRRLDPLLIPLFSGGAVLVLARGWLLITPRPSAPPLPNLGPLEARLAALEARPGFNAAPVESRITALEARPRTPAAPDLAPMAQRPWRATNRSLCSTPLSVGAQFSGWESVAQALF